MTRELASEFWPVMKAFADGKPIQVRNRFIEGDPWEDVNNPRFNSDFSYRVKSEKKYRPWKYEEVPLMVVYRQKNDIGVKMVFTYVDDSYVVSGKHAIKINELLNLFEYSRDDGKTWLPCGILE